MMNIRANYVEKEVMSEYELRQRIIDDLSYVSKMSVGEYTLYQKYLEIQQRYIHKKWAHYLVHQNN